MPVRREHRWQKTVKQFHFHIAVEPDQTMLFKAWQRSKMKTPFAEAMKNPSLARIIRMMAIQGQRQNKKKPLANKKPLEA